MIGIYEYKHNMKCKHIYWFQKDIEKYWCLSNLKQLTYLAESIYKTLHDLNSQWIQLWHTENNCLTNNQSGNTIRDLIKKSPLVFNVKLMKLKI